MKYQVTFHNGEIVVLEAPSYEEAEKTADILAKQMDTSIIHILDEIDAFR